MNEKTRNRVWKWSLIGLFGVAALALAAGGYWLYRGQIILLFTALSMLVTAAMAAFVFSFRQRTPYQSLYRAEHQRRQVEEEIRATFYSIGDGVISTDAAGRVTRMNPVAEHLTGWSEAEALGKPSERVFHIVNEETRADVDNPIQRVLREGTVVNLANHTLLVARDGTERPIADSGAPICSERGQVTGVVLVFRDQTDERRAEEAIKESEAKYKAIFAGAAEGIFVTDIETKRFHYLNTAACRMFGYTEEEFLRVEVPGMFSKEDLDSGMAAFGAHVRGEKSLTADLPFCRKDGSTFYANVNSSLMTLSGRRCIVGLFTDITERKVAEQMLRDSETRHRTLFENSSDAMMTLAPPSWKFTSCNPATERMFNVKDEAEFTSLRPWQLSPEVQPDGRPSAEKAKEMIETAMREGSRLFEWTHKRLNGEDFPATVLLSRMELAGQAVLQATVRDITVQKRAEEKLKDARALLDSALSAIPDVFYVFDASGKFLLWNETFSRVTGYSDQELSAKQPTDFFSGQDFQRIAEAIERTWKDGTAKQEANFVTKDGNQLPYEFTASILRDGAGNTIGFSGTGRDLTERKRAEEKRKKLAVLRQGINELQQRLLTPAPLNDKLKKITEDIVRLFDADFCRIWLLGPGDLCEGDCIHAGVHEGPHVCRYRDRCLHLLASSGRYTHIDGRDHRRVPFGCYKIGRVASGEDHKFLTNDVQNDPCVHNHQWARELGLVSFAGYQLRVPGGETLGVLALFAKDSIAADEDAMLDGLSGTIALVVQQAAAEEALKQFNQQLESAAAQVKSLMSNVIEQGVFTDRFENPGLTPCWEVKNCDATACPSYRNNENLRCWAVAKTLCNGKVQEKFSQKLDECSPCEVYRRARANPVMDLGETFNTMIAILNDRQARLEETNQYLDNLFNYANAPIIVWDPQFRITRFNHAFESLTGRRAGEVVGESLEILFPPTLVESSMERIAETLRGQRWEAVEIRILHVDGSERTVLWNSAAIFGPDAKTPMATIAQGQDITRRKQAEEQALIFRRFAEASGQGLGMATLQGQILYMNQTLCHMLDEDNLEDVYKKGFPEYYNSEFRERLLNEVLPKVMSGGQWVGELALVSTKGKQTPTIENFFLIRDEEGRPLRLADVVTDITERKEMEDDLRKAKVAAEAANRTKSEFLANMSHEIRTPMTSILGYTDLLMDHSLSAADCKTYLTTVRRNGEQLLQLINDILDLSKIEAGKMAMDLGPCHLPSTVAEVASMMRPRAEQRGIALEVRYTGPLPETIHTDADRVRQVLVNLVGNAVKFTENGSIRIGVSLLPQWRSGQAAVSIEVTDTGIGIRQESLARLFEPFTQAESSTTRKYGGTGLGLAISRQIVTALGGELTVRSSFGEGSTFTVTIPTGDIAAVNLLESPGEVICENEAGTRWTPGAGALRGVRILLAEDSIDNQELLRTVLGNVGAEVEVVENGRLAVERAETGTFDVVLMDMNMPEMDGYEATRSLRDRGYQYPILALTANAMTSDAEHCLAAGCNAHLAKPIDRKQLIETVAQYAMSKTSQMQHESSKCHIARGPIG